MAAIKDLREFIALLEKKGQLKRISARVDPNLEIGEITDRVSKQVGPALLFENPVNRETGERYACPVAINLMGSYDRMAWALGVDAETGTWKDLDAVAKRVTDLLPLDMPASMKGKFDILMNLKDLAGGGRQGDQEGAVSGGRAARRRCRSHQAAGAHDLARRRRSIRHAAARGDQQPQGQAQRRHVSAAGLRQEHDRAAHPRASRRREEPAGVEGRGRDTRPDQSWRSAAIRCTIFSATAPVPPMIDEYLFSGILRGEPVEVVKCVTNDLLVPAHAEIVLEGWTDLEETRWEGPFGDHTGYYSLADYFPVFHVEAITMRRDPIYPATIVGPPPMEDDYMGKATERLFLPVIKAMLPEVVDYDLPLEGVFHNCAIFQIKKEFAGQAFRVMNFAWSMGQMMFTKFVIVVDEDVDCHDYSQVAWRCFNNVDPEPRHPDHERAARSSRSLEQPPELRLQDGHRRDQAAARRGPRARVAGLAGDVARGQGARRRDVERARPVSASSLARSEQAGQGQDLRRAGEVRALDLRAAVRVPRGALRSGRRAAARSACAARYAAALRRAELRAASAPVGARSGAGRRWWALLWITVAMVGARSFAFVVNRAVDAEIDARNPRTAGRPIPAGTIKRWELWLFSAVVLAAYVFACFQLAPITHWLWPIPLAFFVVYPYLKRFTWFCHFWLGICLGLGRDGWLGRRRRSAVGPRAVGARCGGRDLDGRIRHHLRHAGLRVRRA